MRLLGDGKRKEEGGMRGDGNKIEMKIEDRRETGLGRYLSKSGVSIYNQLSASKASSFIRDICMYVFHVCTVKFYRCGGDGDRILDQDCR